MDQWRRVCLAAASYFAVVFAGAFALGTLRTFFIEPHVSKLASTAIEAPFLLGLILLTARAVPQRFGLNGQARALIATGVLALVLQQGAEILLGFSLRGLSLADQYSQFLRPEGWLFAALLAAFASAPFLLDPGKKPD